MGALSVESRPPRLACPCCAAPILGSDFLTGIVMRSDHVAEPFARHAATCAERHGMFKAAT